MEFRGVPDSPTVRAFVAEEDGVGVDLFHNLQVALGLDFEDRQGPGAEARDLGAAVRGGEGLGVFPIIELPAHEGRADRLGGAALPDDHGIELEATVDLEDLVAVLEAEEPLPAAVVEEEAAEASGAMVGVESRRDDEAKAALRP
ncbi:MAG TPA: hypothetical protein PLG94_14155, partial [Smithellaceae bacterium]|nr:hypothetical protein [Smithellaceae bacterium]